MTVFQTDVLKRNWELSFFPVTHWLDKFPDLGSFRILSDKVMEQWLKQEFLPRVDNLLQKKSQTGYPLLKQITTSEKTFIWILKLVSFHWEQSIFFSQCLNHTNLPLSQCYCLAFSRHFDLLL